MKLKLDENLPHDLAAELSQRGHDVDTVVEEQLGGQSDPVVVTAATDEDRMLLTLDRGIGDLRRYPPGSHGGIVVLRPVAQDPDAILALVERLVRHTRSFILSSPATATARWPAERGVQPGRTAPRRGSESRRATTEAFTPMRATTWERWPRAGGAPMCG